MVTVATDDMRKRVSDLEAAFLARLTATADDETKDAATRDRARRALADWHEQRAARREATRRQLQPVLDSMQADLSDVRRVLDDLAGDESPGARVRKRAARTLIRLEQQIRKQVDGA